MAGTRSRAVEPATGRLRPHQRRPRQPPRTRTSGRRALVPSAPSDVARQQVVERPGHAAPWAPQPGHPVERAGRVRAPAGRIDSSDVDRTGQERCATERRRGPAWSGPTRAGGAGRGSAQLQSVRRARVSVRHGARRYCGRRRRPPPAIDVPTPPSESRGSGLACRPNARPHPSQPWHRRAPARRLLHLRQRHGRAARRQDTRPTPPPARSADAVRRRRRHRTATVDWKPCPASDDYEVEGWECGTVDVPLDYDAARRRDHHARPHPPPGHRRGRPGSGRSS